MENQETAKTFLSLPNESLPRVYGDCPDDSSPQLWAAVRMVASGKVACGVVESAKITLAADRDGWRDGVEILV